MLGFSIHSYHSINKMYYFLILIIGLNLPSLDAGRVARLVGGDKVSIENFPHQVVLYEEKEFHCGGSILTPRHVLTAAHCFDNDETEFYAVRAGSNSTSTGGSYHLVTRIHTHEDYSANDVETEKDVAVVEVEPPFVFDKYRQPVVLYRTNDRVEPDDWLTVTGFGMISENGPDSDGLTAITIPVVEWKLCHFVYDIYNIIISSDTFCAGYAKGGKDHCYGDSGGPGLIDGRQAGIVSKGLGCGKPLKPGVYTSVADNYLWIKQIVGNEL